MRTEWQVCRLHPERRIKNRFTLVSRRRFVTLAAAEDFAARAKRDGEVLWVRSTDTGNVFTARPFDSVRLNSILKGDK